MIISFIQIIIFSNFYIQIVLFKLSFIYILIIQIIIYSNCNLFMNDLLTLVIWKGVYDRIVYIVKKGINIFFKKGFLGGGHNVA